MTNPESTEEQKVSEFWLNLLGFQLGDRIAVFPAGGGPGMSAKLVEVVILGGAPVALQVQMELDGPRWTIPFAGIFMVTKEPDVKAPDVDLAKLVEFADEQGLPVTDEIRAFASSNDGQEAISE